MVVMTLVSVTPSVTQVVVRVSVMVSLTVVGAGPGTSSVMGQTVVYQGMVSVMT